jgi:hypothetical protein
MKSRVSLTVILGMLCLPSMGAQAPPPPPVVQPFNDGAHWVLVKPFTYRIGTSNYQITVPPGFVTDFASIPAAFRAMVSPSGQHGRAAIIHDFLYWEQYCSREQADWILRLGMIESGVSVVTRQAIYWSVRALGESAWLVNEAERNRGWPRVIPEADIANSIPPLALWPGYRQQLYAKGVRPEARRPEAPAYCAAAMNIVVNEP